MRITCFKPLKCGNLAVGYYGGSIKIWNPTTGDLICTIESGHINICWLEVFADGSIVSGDSVGIIRIFNPTTGVLIREIKTGGTSLWLAILGDGSIVSNSYDSGDVIKIWNPNTGDLIRSFGGRSKELSSLAVMGDGRIVNGYCDGSITIWSLE